MVRVDFSVGGRSIAWESLWNRIFDDVLAKLECDTAGSSHNCE
jgi:hypothetical protein